MACTTTTFPITLHELLCQTEKDGNEGIVYWLPDGESFKVQDRARFSSEIMPSYFGTSNFRSFQKNLNMWGFTTVRGGGSRGICSHPLFSRDFPHLCHRMVRHRSFMTKTKTNATDCISKSSKNITGGCGSTLNPPSPDRHDSRSAERCPGQEEERRLSLPPIQEGKDEMAIPFALRFGRSTHKGFEYVSSAGADQGIPRASSLPLSKKSQKEAALFPSLKKKALGRAGVSLACDSDSYKSGFPSIVSSSPKEQLVRPCSISRGSSSSSYESQQEAWCFPPRPVMTRTTTSDAWSTTTRTPLPAVLASNDFIIAKKTLPFRYHHQDPGMLLETLKWKHTMELEKALSSSRNRARQQQEWQNISPHIRAKAVADIVGSRLIMDDLFTTI